MTVREPAKGNTDTDHDRNEGTVRFRTDINKTTKTEVLFMRKVIMYGVDKLYGGVCKLKEELDKIRIREMNLFRN